MPEDMALFGAHLPLRGHHVHVMNCTYTLHEGYQYMIAVQTPHTSKKPWNNYYMCQECITYYTLLNVHICMCTDKHQCTLAYIHVLLLKYRYTHTLRQLLGVGKVQEAHVAYVRTFPKPNNCYRVRAYQYFNWFVV